jgi:hypothetical protein
MMNKSQNDEIRMRRNIAQRADFNIMTSPYAAWEVKKEMFENMNNSINDITTILDALETTQSDYNNMSVVAAEFRQLCHELEDKLGLYEAEFDNPAQAQYIKSERKRLNGHADMLENERVNIIGNLEIMTSRCEVFERVVKGECQFCVNEKRDCSVVREKDCMFEFNEKRFSGGA